ncbi:MAG: hypothetical protein Q4F21_00815 [Lachnospiraceae bacterium]|nr:hypothetical protein [Lachnospiraceae bacterium]
MIDLHVHILPGVDDGAPYQEISLEMAEQAVRGGVDRLVMTPHCNIPEMFDNYNDDDVLRKQMEDFKRQVEQAEIPLTLYTGMEVFGTPEVPDHLRDGRLLTINDTRYLLIEFPFGGDSMYVTSILEAILALDYIPIVAHPERYRYVQEEPETVDYWIRMGCGMQVNKGSVLGRFGRGAWECSNYLLEEGMVSCVASDAHHSEWRTTYMDEIEQYLITSFGREYTDFLTRLNPERILAGKNLLWPVD